MDSPGFLQLLGGDTEALVDVCPAIRPFSSRGYNGEEVGRAAKHEGKHELSYLDEPVAVLGFTLRPLARATPSRPATCGGPGGEQSHKLAGPDKLAARRRQQSSLQ